MPQNSHFLKFVDLLPTCLLTVQGELKKESIDSEDGNELQKIVLKVSDTTKMYALIFMDLHFNFHGECMHTHQRHFTCQICHAEMFTTSITIHSDCM